MKEISLKDFENIRIGQVEDRENGTGCTVIICEDGMCAGMDVRGGGPAIREGGLLSPYTHAQAIHALVLGGGSAFGLDAAGGVMEYLEGHGIGYAIKDIRVPLVVQADIFDLFSGSSKVRPGKQMGYDACVAAEEGRYQDGCYGAGTGAAVGKIYGPEYIMKSGIGSYAVQVGDVKVAAIVVVNAFGDIYDYKTGKEIAGPISEDGHSLRSSAEYMYELHEMENPAVVGNTTIGAIITNASFDKAQLCKIASMAQNGLARTIRPVHTSNDGDTVFALSTKEVNANQDMVGTLAADVMAEAIVRGVKAAESMFGFRALKDLDLA